MGDREIEPSMRLDLGRSPAGASLKLRVAAVIFASVFLPAGH
jgi:hypothetical protein